jgi:hypothetical protein
MIKLDDSQPGWGLKTGLLIPFWIESKIAIEFGITYVNAKFEDFSTQVKDGFGTRDLYYSNPSFSLLMVDAGLHFLILDNPKISAFGLCHVGQRSADTPEYPQETTPPNPLGRGMNMDTDIVTNYGDDKEFTAGLGIG